MNAKFTKPFKKDFARIVEGTPLESEFEALFDLLISGVALPARFRDHPLKGDWKGFRDCHLRGDLVLIYRRDKNEITFVRLNSHSELFK